MSELARRKIYVAGHGGMVGSALLRALARVGAESVCVRSHAALDLCDARAVRDYFASERPEFVLLAAARVGGIHANDTQPADFIADNLAIALNVIRAAHEFGVQRLLFLGSSCIYPRLAPQPMREEHLLTGLLEPTNEPYAIAKIAGIKLCESFRRQYGDDFRSVMPTNLYGPGDNFDREGSHVIPALLRRFHEAKCGAQEAVVVWGSGSPRREFLHVDDLAEACLHVLALARARYEAATTPRCTHLNVGTGEDLTIAELARLVADTVGYQGRITFDANKPDGAPRKLLDVARMHAQGWRARIGLADGLGSAYAWFREHAHEARGVSTG